MPVSQTLLDRRSFLAGSAKAAAAAGLASQAAFGPASGRVLGANDRVRMGFIGVGNRGSELLQYFMANPDVEIAALCDVYEPYLLRDRSMVDPRIVKEVGNKVPRMAEKFSSNPERYKDFRKLLENRDIDAVCIATPDHWHAVQTILACQAGKDVYVEKPLTITIAEGRAMVTAAKATGRVVQVGLNRRGSSVYRKAADLVHAGKIGKVTVARAYYSSRMYPAGIGNAAPGEPPAGLDWDMWLGPRATRPYQYTIAPYRFRWWRDYSSQIANWGIHFTDAIRWLMDEKAPSSVSAHGGKYLLKDDRTIPDTMEVTFEFASGAIVVFGVYEASGGPTIAEGEVELRGALGTLYVDERHYHLLPSSPGQFQDAKEMIAEEENRAGDEGASNLVRNFIDCVKSRKKPLCDVEEGHRSTTFAHLANIALEKRARLEWDAENERVTNLPEANSLLSYEYRKPWRLS